MPDVFVMVKGMMTTVPGVSDGDRSDDNGACHVCDGHGNDDNDSH